MRLRGDAPAKSEAADRSMVAAQWSILIGRLTDRLSHEIRNPLNGAMVNLQVVSSRAGRSGHDAAALKPFAVSAAAELERAAALIEALLVALRPVPPASETDVPRVLRTLVPLYRAVVTRAGGSLEYDQGDVTEAAVAIQPETVRLALAGALEAATRDGAAASVRLECTASSVIARLRRAGGVNPIASELSVLVEGAGITAEHNGDFLALHFPAVGAGEDE